MKSVLVLTLLLSLLLGGQCSAKNPPEVKLVCLLVVDQLRGDALQRQVQHFLPARDAQGQVGGFNYLLQQGADHRQCYYDTLPTQTAVGHATLVTGAWPGQHGIVANSWRQPGAAADTLAEGPQSSPVNLLASTLGDELRLASRRRSRVISLAGKARAAVLMGGKLANAALWQDEKGQWTSSSYYSALPPWLRADNAGFSQSWTWQPLTATPSLDSPHVEKAYRGPWPIVVERPAQAVASPWSNRRTLELASQWLVQENLGQQQADMLCLSFSAYDKLAHMVGPQHPSLGDMLLHLDRDLSAFLQLLEARLGLQHCLIALSADHGGSPIPEEYPELGRRCYAHEAQQALETALTRRLGAGPQVAYFSDPHVVLSRPSPRHRQVAAETLRGQPGVVEAWTQEEILQGRLPRTDLAERVARSYLAGRSGDLYWIQSPFWSYPYDGKTPVGNNHGSPWSHDSHVPLLLCGPGIRPGPRWRDCSPRDLAPTLAARLGLVRPSAASGRVLQESFLDE